MEDANKTLNDSQVWALSETGQSLFKSLIDSGVDLDIAFELTLNLLGEEIAISLPSENQT
jgi:hypothetical protein